jgi:uncharacterized membrane protein YtjA (UPF0391 family)
VVRALHFSLVEGNGASKNKQRVDKGGKEMLWTILIVLLVLWALGFGFAGAAVGNLIHILLVLALVVLAVQLITGRRAAL